MIPRIHIDTSVVGGIFDLEFEFFTDLFFKQLDKGEIKIIVSDLLESELLRAPKKI